MFLQTLWDYFGNFDDREGFRILVLTMFLFGVPLAIGVWAKVVVWATRQVRHCQQVLWTTQDAPVEQMSG